MATTADVEVGGRLVHGQRRQPLDLGDRRDHRDPATGGCVGRARDGAASSRFSMSLGSDAPGRRTTPGAGERQSSVEASTWSVAARMHRCDRHRAGATASARPGPATIDTTVALVSVAAADGSAVIRIWLSRAEPAGRPRPPAPASSQVHVHLRDGLLPHDDDAMTEL